MWVPVLVPLWVPVSVMILWQIHIKAIYIGAPDKSSGQRRQDIHIVYDLIGFIPLGELMEEEMA